MFEDSLMESTRHFSKRRGWTILLSSGVQTFVLATLVILPLLHTDAISPKNFKVITGIRPYIPQPTSSGHRPLMGRTDSGSTAPTIVQVVQPSSIPNTIDRRPETEGRPVAQPICLVDCGIAPGVPGGTDIAPPPSIPKPFRPIISKFDPGQIIFQVKPVYPRLAIETRIQGPVSLHALIGRDGLIENLQVVSGHPWLVKAALDAVSQWRFRPYILNGQPIEVETEITVNFTLDGAGH